MAFEGIPGGFEVCQRIKDLGTEGILSNITQGTINLLAYNGAP
jgi:hypothetical protein